jgi:hypothetical protein
MNGGVTVWDRSGQRPKRVRVEHPNQRRRVVYRGGKPARRVVDELGKVRYV